MSGLRVAFRFAAHFRTLPSAESSPFLTKSSDSVMDRVNVAACSVVSSFVMFSDTILMTTSAASGLPHVGRTCR